MNIQSPNAAVAIVAPVDGRMRSHFQRVMQALCEDANGLFAGTVSGPAATLDGISSGRSLIRIEFDLVPASDNVSLYLLARTGTGTEVVAYSWSRPYNDAAATMASVTDTSDPQIILAAAVRNTADAGGISGRLTIHNIQSSRFKRVSGHCVGYDGARERFSAIAGRIDTALPITGVSLRFSAGDIASGYARVEAP